MAKKRIYNTVRTDLFEVEIVNHLSIGAYDAADAVERLANLVGAPIDMEEIRAEAERRREYFRSIGVIR